MTKLTKKEKFAYIREHNINDELIVEFCDAEIAALDAKAAKAKANAAAKREAGDALKVKVREALTEDFQSIADITAALGDEDVTVAKVTYRLNALVEEGVAVKEDATIEGVDGGKSRKIKVFRLA